MSFQKMLPRGISIILIILCSCANPAATPVFQTPATTTTSDTPQSSTTTYTVTPAFQTSTATPTTDTSVAATASVTPQEAIATPTIESIDLWENATGSTIYATKEWTNKVELADINSDGLVDILFANGGDYDTPGQPEFSRIFLNQGPGQLFTEVTQDILGSDGMLARVIKVRDVNNDQHPDIMVGTTYQTQSRLYLSDGSGNFTEVTTTHLPQIMASVGDLEFGDVDEDGDLDVVLADWGPENPMSNEGGRTMLWLNDGEGYFSDATATNMPDIRVRFSWDLEFVDVNNDYDLDILVSCKKCSGNYMFENDGNGVFTDVSIDRLPQFANNYDFEAMDVNGDDYLDLVTINDGIQFREHLFLNNGQGGYVDSTSQFWPPSENPGCDDNMIAFLDFDSDGDADFLIGSLDCSDRLLENDGSGHLKLSNSKLGLEGTPGTLGIALADLNGDHKLDVVNAQGEVAFSDQVYFGKGLQPDTAAPVISLVEEVTTSTSDQSIQIRARVYDNKSPTMPHDWQSVMLRWTANGQTLDIPMQWYGEYLWRGVIDNATGDFNYRVCAIDAAGNESCSP